MRKLWSTTVIIIVCIMFISSCAKDSARITGRLVCDDSVVLYLEQRLPSGTKLVDSTTTNEKGEFKFKFKLPSKETTLYTLKKGNEEIQLFISTGERVKIHSVGNLARNYVVEGSPESERLRELRMLLTRGVERMDSVLTLYGAADEQTRRELSQAYNSIYIKTKQNQIQFIVSEPASLSSLYALYQRLPGDNVLSSVDDDIVYYRLVADSTSALHPNSPYVKILLSEIENEDRARERAELLSKKINEAEVVAFPDINLPDMYGKEHRLSELEGHLILLDFWSVLSNDAMLNNAEMRELYDRFSEHGLKIYQVSVDKQESRPLWVRSVQQQKLPWASVNDFGSGGTLAASRYNVQSVPANFLIDRSGNVVTKNLYGKQLIDKIQELLK